MSHVASQYVNCWEDSTRFKLLYRFLEGLDLHGGLNYSERTLIGKVVPDRDDANRPLSLVLAGESSQRMVLAATVQQPLQSR